MFNEKTSTNHFQQVQPGDVTPWMNMFQVP